MLRAPRRLQVVQNCLGPVNGGIAMNRAVGTILTGVMAALIAVPVSAAPAAPGAGAGVAQFAEADWVRIKGKTGTYYFAFAERMVHDGGVSTIGVVGRGDCTVDKNKHFTMIMCEASGKGKEIPPEDFVLDPVLGSASLKVTLGKTTHQASWIAADDAPTVYAGQVVGPDGADAESGMARYATAAGTLFGKKLKSTDNDFAFLIQGAGAGAYTRVTSFDYDDGVVHATTRFRIPR